MKPIVLVTGGSDGLGKAIGATLSSDYQVVILAPNAEKTAAAAKEIGADFQICDVSDQKTIDSAIKNILDKYHQIDVLINNAGIWIEGELDTNDPSQIKKVLDVNSLGTILLSRAVIPSMKAKKSGRIINVISQAGLYPRPNVSVYAASKWAIVGFAKSIEEELLKYHIGVSGIYPAVMKTKMRDLDSGLDPQEVAKMIKFILSYPPNISFPELGIRNINYF